MLNLFSKKVQSLVSLKIFFIISFINLLITTNALAQPTSAALSVVTHGTEAGPVNIEYTVTLDAVNNTGGTIFFNFNPTGGTATNGSDYVDFTGSAIAVLNGNTTGSFTVIVNNDALFENTETLIATISSPVPPLTITTPSATANITDDDNGAGSITADLTKTADGDENGPVDIQFTVTLSQANNTNATIDFPISQTGGTAVAADYAAFTTISVPHGSSVGTLNIAVVDDNLIENLEDLTATMLAPSDPAIMVTTNMATATITDSDSGAGTVNVDLSAADGDEDGPMDVVYTVTLAKTNGTGAAFVYDIDPIGGTAIAGTDFVDFAGTGTVSIPDGSNTGTFTATVIDDSLLDGTRSLQAQITGTPHAALTINTGTATANIADDETATADLSASVQGVEGGANIEYTVTLSKQNDTGAPITFNIDPTAGTAVAGTDYTSFAGQTISVANGASTGTLTVTVTDDALLESTETVTATITNPSLASVTIDTGIATANITDNDTANADLSATDGDEDGPVDIDFTVTLSKVNNTGAPITFSISATGGTAALADYSYPGNIISVADGSSTGSITVGVVDDTLLEATETLESTISVPSHAGVMISTAAATANIFDNDTATAVLSETTDGVEGAVPTNMVYLVTLDKTNNTGVAITFDIDPTGGSATAGSDYTDFTVGGVISVANGASTGTFTAFVLDDADLEGTETVQATISNSSNPAVSITTASHTIDITDNETATAALSVTTHGDEDGTDIVYTVTLSGTNNSGSAIDFDIEPTGGSATAVDDYTDFTGTISVANGMSTGTLTVPVVDDTLFENNETVEATISNPSLPEVTIMTASATATIADNDNDPASINASLSVTTHGDEDLPTNIVYTVTLAKANNTGSAINFDIDPTLTGTAVVGDDFMDFAGQTISVPNGSATGTFTANVIDDIIFDGDRTVEAVISMPSDPAINIFGPTATATIADDEAPEADLSVSVDGDETGPVNITFTVDLSLTNNTGGNVTVDLAATGGNATAGDDYVGFVPSTVTIANGTDTANFVVTVLDDVLYENDETLEATISNPSHPNLVIGTATDTADIADDDNTGITAAITATTAGDETGPVNLVYTVTISKVNNTHVPVTFDINPTGGNSTHTQDYTNFAGQTVSIADGTDTGTFNVTIVDDMRFENNETLQATISNVSDPAAITITTAAATETIIDNDNAPGSVDAVLSRTSDGSETGTSLISYSITLEKPNHTHQPIVFDVDPTGGTATAGTDYDDFATNTMTVPDGSSFATILIPVNDDLILEGTETVQATIANPTDPAIGIVTATATANVLDDDDAVANLSVSTNGDETGPVSIVYTVTLDKVNNTGAAVTFSINPTAGSATVTSDYANFTGSTISVANGASTGTLTVVVVDDSDFENTETVQATISNSSSSDVTIGTASATAMITDNDNTAASIGAHLSVTQNGEEDGNNIIYTVTLDQPNTTGSPITVNIDPFSGTATTDDDYTDFAGAVVSIANNSSTGSYTVTVVDDELFENTETLEAEISNPSDPAVFISTPNAIANIVDDDNGAGTIAANLSVSQNGSENGPQSVIFTVTLDEVNNTGAPITFDLFDDGGSATVVDDYVAFNAQTITVNNGASTGTLAVTIVDDALFENSETLSGDLSNPSDPAVFVDNDEAGASITDNDNTANSIDADLSVTANGNEAGPVSIQYTVTLDTTNNTGSPINFTINPSGGSASVGADYTDFSGGTISVAPGDNTGTFTVAVVDDALFENTETLEATISAASDPAINIATAEATANLTDNDNAAASVTAALSATTNGSEAGPVSVVYTVTLSAVNNTSVPVNFTINPTGGTATNASDYIDFSGGTISVPAGSNSGTFSVTVANDTLFESTETLIATISAASDPAISITTASASANIADDDSAASTINADLSVTTNGSETGPTSIVYRVTLASINNTGSAITFNINPTAGTATAGTDYTNFTGSTITVANGASFGTTTVPVVNDALYENTETVQATISSPSNAAITINTASATANIVDNDNAVNSVNANLSVTTHGNEAGPVSIVYTVTLATTNNTGGAIQFSINPSGGTAAAGTDYTNFAGSLISIANGTSSGTLTVPVVDDALFENTETVQATITNPTDPAINIVASTVLANITDNDNGAATNNATLAVTTHGDENGSVSAVFQVSLATPNNTGSAITLNISPTGGSAVAGIDYNNFSGSVLSIANGASTASVTVPVTNDELFENTETIIATISGASDPAINIATAMATANIVDSDNVAGSIDTDLSITTNGDEDGPTSIVYKVTISEVNNTHGPITVAIDPTGGNATAGTDFFDFTGNTVTIADGQTTGSITVAVTDDALFENDETVETTISTPSDPALAITTASATANIADNDNAAGSISASFQSSEPGEEDGNVDMEYTVTIDKVNNTHAPITFDIAIVGGTATAGDDYDSVLSSTVTIPDGSDTGTFLVTGVVDDTLFENNETVILDIANPSDPAISIVNVTATASGIIIDDDNAAGSVDADLSVTTNGSETGPVNVVYTVTLANTNNTHGPITFSIDPTDGSSTAGTDYVNFAGGVVTVADGSDTGTFTVTVNDDSLFENQEDLEATISNASDPAININTAADTATIADNDNAPGSVDAQVSVTTNGSEAGPIDIVYTVTLGLVNNTHGNITFSINPSGGTADSGSDYNDFTAGVVTVADGSATGTFTVSVIDDVESENLETASATISAASDPAIAISAASATASITDNDGFDLLEPVYFMWNGYLNQINILALANKANVSNAITATMFDLNGTQLSVSNFTLNAGSEFDLIVNQLAGFAANQYGIVKIDYTQPMSIEGQSSISRVKSSNPNDYEYSLLHALSNKRTGRSYAFFNTFQPSLDPSDAGNIVFSYAQIANLSTTNKLFRVAKLTAGGATISTVDIAIPAGGRRDIEAGHEVPGANNIGLISITPIDGSGMLDPTTEYLAQIATYGTAGTGFDFAINEEFRAGDGDVQFINVSRGANAQNWIAIANTDSASQLVNYKVINNSGATLVNTNFNIPAFGQLHVSPNTVLGVGESGMVLITPESGKTVVANSRSYFSDGSGSITSASLEESRDILRGTLYTTYNTFIQQQNWLRIFNVGTNNVTINIEVLAASGTSLGNTDVNINAGTGTDLEVSSSLGIVVPFNSYGLIKVTSNDNPSIVAHILRLKPDTATGTIVDLGKALPLR